MVASPPETKVPAQCARELAALAFDGTAAILCITFFITVFHLVRGAFAALTANAAAGAPGAGGLLGHCHLIAERR